jgi:hypothetical protein
MTGRSLGRGCSFTLRDQEKFTCGQTVIEPTDNHARRSGQAVADRPPQCAIFSAAKKNEHGTLDSREIESAISCEQSPCTLWSAEPPTSPTAPVVPPALGEAQKHRVEALACACQACGGEFEFSPLEFGEVCD